MSEIINLNKARKRRERAQAQVQAAQNRVLFGRTKEQKRREAHEAEAARHKLDQLRRDPPSEESPDKS